MTLQENQFGRIAEPPAESGDDVLVDVGSLLRRLLLFEHVTIESISLQEIPALVAAFGHDGLRTLLESGAVDIIQDAQTVGQIGQTDLKVSEERGFLLPPGSFHFASVEIADWEDYRNTCLGAVDGIEHLSRKNANHLKNVLVERVRRYPEGAAQSGVESLRTELAAQDAWLIEGARTLIAREVGEADDSLIAVEVEDLGGGDFRVATNAGERYRLDEQAGHKVVERSLLALGGLNQRIAFMESLDALTGFKEDEVPIFTRKLRFVADALNPTDQERRFDRVVSIQDLPSLADLKSDTRVDIDRLLQIRDDPECREFRAWLRGLDKESDAEIAERFRNVHERIASATHSKAGTAVRLAIQSGVGLIPVVGGAAGIAASAADKFVADKLIGRPGPVSFIGHKYRSIFE